MPVAEAVRPTTGVDAVAQALRQQGGDYGEGRLKEMCLPTTDKSSLGADAIDITLRGLRIINTEAISTHEPISFEEAVRNSFAFMQVFGIGATSETRSVASISTGLPWDRQSPMEHAAASIVLLAAGDKAKIRTFGGDKLVAFIETDESAEAMLQRFVHAPREVYQEQFPHLADAVSQMQAIRERELLDPNFGNGRVFLDTFYGVNKHLGRRAHQNDNKYSFVFDYENKGKDGLWGINVDNVRQRLTELAIDDPTREMLRAIEAFLTQEPNGLNRFVIEFDFSSTVSCCNTSFNAQHSSLWENDAITVLSESTTLSETSLLADHMVMYPNGEKYTSKDFCETCHKNRKAGKCTCEKQKEE